VKVVIVKVTGIFDQNQKKGRQLMIAYMTMKWIEKKTTKEYRLRNDNALEKVLNVHEILWCAIILIFGWPYLC